MGYAALFGALAGAMIVFPGPAAEAARQGLELWARAVVPVLGPFMACMLMIVPRMGGRPWLRVGLSWLCGSPGGAKIMQSLRLNGPSALRFAALTGTMSPMFFLGTLSAWLGSPAAGWMLLACHFLGALILGLCVPGNGQSMGEKADPPALSDVLRQTALALLSVGLCMMLGCVAARMTACAFPHLPPAAAAALQCILEVTAGTKALIALQSPFTLPLVCAACSFGGLSILMQNAAFWQESGVNAGQLLLLRLIHGALSGTLCFGLASVFPFQ